MRSFGSEPNLLLNLYGVFMDKYLYPLIIFFSPQNYDGDVKELALDFTVEEDLHGKRTVIELKPGGKSIAVTNDNKLQYVYALADYKLNLQVQTNFVSMIFIFYLSYAVGSFVALKTLTKSSALSWKSKIVEFILYPVIYLDD